MSPEELQILDSSIKIGLGGLIGIVTSIVGGVIAYKIAIAGSEAKIKEKYYDNINEILKESVIHINHYHSNLSQYLHMAETLDNLSGDEGETRKNKLTIEFNNIVTKLFNEGNSEVDLAYAKLLFVSCNRSYELLKKYEASIDEFYKVENLSSQNIVKFRKEINNQFMCVINEISISRKKTL